MQFRHLTLILTLGGALGAQDLPSGFYDEVNAQLARLKGSASVQRTTQEGRLQAARNQQTRLSGQLMADSTLSLKRGPMQPAAAPRLTLGQDGLLHFQAAVPHRRVAGHAHTPEAGRRLVADFLKAAQLPSADLELVGTATHMAAVEGQQATAEDIRFDYRRRVEGIPAQGPGTRLSVTTAKEGHVSAAQLDWADFQSAERVPLLPPAQKLDELQAIRHQLNRQDPAQPVQRLEPKAIRLIYHSQAKGGTQELVPAYQVVCAAHTGDGQPSRTITFVLSASERAPVLTPLPAAPARPVQLPPPAR